MKRWYLTTAVLGLALVMAACGEQRAITAAPKILSFSAAPGTLAAAEGEVMLNWEIEGATTELIISPEIGPVSGSSVRITPMHTTTYTLTAGNAHGSHSAEVTVRVEAPEPSPPDVPSGLGSDLMGLWAFEIVGEKGSTLSGSVYIDSDFTYEGIPGIGGLVADCQGNELLCADARLGGLVPDPDTDRYRFGLSQMDLTLVFMGEDLGGSSSASDDAPLLSGVGLLGEDEAARFEVYKLSD
jgi:hypothetical protein